LQGLRGKCINFLYIAPRLALMIVVTRCHILRLKCTKFDFRWGCAPDTAGATSSAPPDSLAGFKGLLLRGDRGRDERRREGKG